MHFRGQNLEYAYFLDLILQTRLFCSGISKSGSLKYILFCLGLKRSKKESREDALLKMYSQLIERAGANARHAEESTSNPLL